MESVLEEFKKKWYDFKKTDNGWGNQRFFKENLTPAVIDAMEADGWYGKGYSWGTNRSYKEPIRERCHTVLTSNACIVRGDLDFVNKTLEVETNNGF